MIFKNYKEIPYAFLHDAALVISKRFEIEYIHMDRHGEVCITLRGQLTEQSVKQVLQNLYPQDKSLEEIDVDFEYWREGGYTHVYSPDGIDYRNL